MTRRERKYTAAIILMLSVLLLTSCRTTKIIQTVYPELDFKDLPNPKIATPLDKDLNEVTDIETDIEFVLIDSNYFIELADFKLSYQELQAKYNGFVEGLER